MQARLQHKSSELAGLSGREEELKERLNDLNAFVEVRLHVCLLQDISFVFFLSAKKCSCVAPNAFVEVRHCVPFSGQGT